MSTNDTHPDNDSGPPWDDPAEDCPIDRLATTDLACARLRDRAVSGTTTVRARDVASLTPLSSKQASYALRALAAADAETLADRGLEPAVTVSIEHATDRYQRFHIAEAQR